MRVRFPHLVALCLILGSTALSAAEINRIEIHGLDDEMTANVREVLSLEDARDKDISDRRLDYLVEVAEAETREALEPFGYYNPVIKVTTSGDRNALAVIIEVDKGEPVRIRGVNLAISGDGSDDRYLREELENFEPRKGEVMDHEVYEGSKAFITRRLAERGYFDAAFEAHRVEVTRAQNAADIDLRWNSGDRYNMGPVTFEQTPEEIIYPRILEKLIYWNQGEYYHQGRIDRLRRSLTMLDYFSTIDIEPHPDQAVGDREVPVTVKLKPAKRSIYTLGVSYGTLDGPGFNAGVERRYLNKRGHKAAAYIDYGKRRKTATLQYRIPAFKWLDGWYTIGAQYSDEQTDYIDSRRVEAVFSRSGEINRNLTATASLHFLRERWSYSLLDDAAPGKVYEYASLYYPQIRVDYVNVDDRLYPRRGWGVGLTARGGAVRGQGAFGQLQMRGQWFKGIGDSDRLIVRGELGRSFHADTAVIPPSLRFYAGGDRSIRGYNWREVGPRLIDATGKKRYALGADNLFTTSVEYEHYFRPQWGVAAFVDSGSAFNGKTPDWHTGVGVGVRWRSPVGPVRIDIARGLNTPDSAFTLHFNIGADL
ncbi:autotransporter assembly complex protein TamA [Lysobacter soyae]|uniref:Translocation and assembly module subunit TamA n=1 Tax=Lysobacter soyae TaxID=2764185 RepID=A0ABX8WPS3_9GAMM|nr:autotransporter assembly complex family protein [Lysobacter sp. CJ11]QYR53066.1 autotransporter assembly complex protein TamA [Lysobacter sp. CJ11]